MCFTIILVFHFYGFDCTNVAHILLRILLFINMLIVFLITPQFLLCVHCYISFFHIQYSIHILCPILNLPNFISISISHTNFYYNLALPVKNFCKSLSPNLLSFSNISASVCLTNFPLIPTPQQQWGEWGRRRMGLQ